MARAKNAPALRGSTSRHTEAPGVFSVSPPAPPSSAVDPATTRATDEAAGRYEEVISTAGIDRRLLRGPFATHVWGGRYAVIALRGQGAQGATFVAVDAQTGARVAVKLFDLGRAKDWKAVELFDREAATLQRLSHPGVPRFVDVLKDDDGGACALVMGLVDGDTLADVLRRDGPLPEKRLWPVLFEATGVLAAVHGEGVVHRDLKPAHLILRPDGRVAIVDFGGVGAIRSEAGSTVVGTFGYMAPEQLYGAQTPATDLYALGATLLYAATGKAPDEHPRQGLAVDVDAAAPFLSLPLRALLARLLSPDPQGRPKDAAALLRELQGLGARRTSSTTPSATGTTNAGDDDVVDAVWREDEAQTALAPGRGAVGLLAALVALLATVGVGRVLLPALITVVGLFVSDAERRRLRAVRDVVARRTRVAAQQLSRAAADRAVDLEHDVRRRRRQEEKAARRQEKKAARRQGFWRS